MFWVASDTIAAKHPELEGAVRAVDEHLRVNAGHTIRVGFTADVLGINRDLLARLLRLYESEGVVKPEAAYVCPDCDGFLERTPGEGDLWCDVCEKSFSYRGHGPIGEMVWRVLAGAAKTGWQPPAEVVPAEPAAPTVVIQFVAGDRGGGPRAQLQLPGEERAIREAIALGQYRDMFEFAPPVYAASIDNMIACHRHRPGIVHCVGYGEDRRMVLLRDRDLLVDMILLDPGQVETLFGNFPVKIRLVVFNTCRSLELARHLTENGVVDMAIGIEGLIPDDHAVRFARTFYRQLADGLSVKSAFEFATLQLGGTDPTARPQLVHAPEVDVAQVFLAGPGQ